MAPYKDIWDSGNTPVGSQEVWKAFTFLDGGILEEHKIGDTAPQQCWDAMQNRWAENYGTVYIVSSLDYMNTWNGDLLQITKFSIFFLTTF